MKKGLVILGISALILTGCGNVTDIECNEVVTYDGKEIDHKITATVEDNKVVKINITYEPKETMNEIGQEYDDKIDDLKIKFGSKMNHNNKGIVIIENVSKLENGTEGSGLTPNKFIKEVKFENPKISCKTKSAKPEKDEEKDE